MKARSIGIVAAVAGAAFVAGTYWSDGATAMAQQGEEIPAEMQKQMEAWMALGTPGKHHEKLKELAGTWEGTFKMWMAPDTEPMESTGTVTRKWVLGGRFLEEKVHAESAMGAFNGLGYTGYNNYDGRYEFVWMEDMSTGIMSGTGRYDADENAFIWRSEHRDPTSGRVVVSVNTLEVTSPGHHVYIGWQIDENGKKFKAFEGHVERK